MERPILRQALGTRTKEFHLNWDYPVWNVILNVGEAAVNLAGRIAAQRVSYGPSEGYRPPHDDIANNYLRYFPATWLTHFSPGISKNGLADPPTCN